MEIADSHRTPSSKRHRHVNLTGGDEDDEDAILVKNSGPTGKILRQWHQPGSRIYRVSRASGGKDRHSKVYTAKGLRDRRVRLSVSTAIQFYDLQDRLGYDQPSKAIEWLIKAADSAIAELPSLDTMFPSDEITPKQEMVITTHIAGDVNQQISSASETSKGSLTPRSENLNPQSSFTELLTGGGGPSDYFTQLKSGGHQSIPSEFGSMVPFEMQQFDFLQQQQDHFFPAGNGGGDNYNLNFSISSSALAGFHRGTLQSNSPSQFPHHQQQQHVPFLFGAAASTATSAHEGQYPAGFDQHLELKGKGKGKG